MTSDPALDAVEQRLSSTSAAHRPFQLPILRALANLGGSAPKREVVAEINRLLAPHLTPKQLAYLGAKGRFGWVRFELKSVGLVGGEYGTWTLTDLGQRYVAAHQNDELETPANIPESDEPPPSTMKTETVQVTGFKAYEVPLLEVLSEGVTEKRAVLDALHARLADALLPGDERKMPGGVSVWVFRVSWALSNLGKAGDAQNIGSGVWSITDAGRKRLERERAQWDIRAFQSATARVQVEGIDDGDDTDGASHAPWTTERWDALRSELPPALFEALRVRLRPDLGPTPEGNGRPLARNVILYGPPGTSKTYLAKKVASALTGDDAGGGDGRFRLVQFHPSYAYEDFIQGLRPDLKQTELRYVLDTGPFVQIAEAAAQEPDAFFVLVIDEINRGDPARIFGELLYALEYRDEPVTMALGGELTVPPNLIVIGTMNSVDRSVALVDYALRRRFGFVRVDPAPSVISAVHGDGILAEAGPVVLATFNEWLAKKLDREHVIGHAFFINPSIEPDRTDVFDQIWTLDVAPLLEEYFFGDAESLREAALKWRSIVGDALADKSEIDAEEEEAVAAAADER